MICFKCNFNKFYDMGEKMIGVSGGGPRVEVRDGGGFGIFDKKKMEISNEHGEGARVEVKNGGGFGVFEKQGMMSEEEYKAFAPSPEQMDELMAKNGWTKEEAREQVLALSKQESITPREAAQQLLLTDDEDESGFTF